MRRIPPYVEKDMKYSDTVISSAIGKEDGLVGNSAGDVILIGTSLSRQRLDGAASSIIHLALFFCIIHIELTMRTAITVRVDLVELNRIDELVLSHAPHATRQTVLTDLIARGLRDVSRETPAPSPGGKGPGDINPIRIHPDVE
jgi:hypothetical protein